MAKKRSHSKVPKYKTFKLHGKHDLKTVFIYAFFDLVISAAIGVFLQSQVMQALASTY